MSLFDYVSEGEARRHFNRWYNWATHCRLQPVIEVTRTLKGRLADILTYLKHRVTNATAESVNAKIQRVKYTARGFQNKENFQTAVYFHCGSLDMAPSRTQNPEFPYFI